MLRGGDTWHFGNTSASPSVGGTWTWIWSGSSTNCQLDGGAGAVIKTGCIYIGVDQTWFNGGSFSRPIFTQDNPINNARPTSCVFDATSFNAINLASNNYLILDNLEMSGACWNGAASAGWISAGGTQVEISNLYIHGWMYGSGSSDDDYFGISGNMAKSNYILCDHNVFDNSDGSLGNMAGSYQASGFAITNSCKEIAYSVFHQLSNGCICNPTRVHDNFFSNLYEPQGVQHGNVTEWNSANSGSGGTISFYNNIVSNTDDGETIDIETTTGQKAYVFNNVMWGVGNSGNCFLLDANSGAQTYYFFNNTIEYACTARSVTSGTTNMVLQNNHFIGSPQNLSWFTSLPNSDNGNEIFQSEATANGQGYLGSNNYEPTSAGDATVGTGSSAASICSAIADLVVASACTSATGGGTTAVPGQGGLVASYPTIPVVPRPSSGSWDAGAYQYAAGGAVAPPTKLTAVAK
jgi:hypothetical protein